MATRLTDIGPIRIRSDGVIDANGVGEIVFDFTAYLQGRRGLITRMIAGLALSTAELLRDSFQRVVAGGWGTPNLGPDWVTLAAGAGAISVDGSRGRFPATGGGIDFVHSPIAVADMQVLFLCTARNGAVGLQTRQVLRSKDVANLYYFQVDNAATPNLRITRRLASVDTNLISTTKALVAPFFMRSSIVGTTLTATAWNQGDDEPVPDLTVSDGSIVGVGGAGAGANLTANLENVSIDDLVAVPPEAIAGPNPVWDAYIGSTLDPTNLVDSSQGVALPRWVPSLVNGQPVNQGDKLTIVAQRGSPGKRLVASCYLVTAEVV